MNQNVQRWLVYVGASFPGDTDILILSMGLGNLPCTSLSLLFTSGSSFLPLLVLLRPQHQPEARPWALAGPLAEPSTSLL